VTLLFLNPGLNSVRIPCIFKDIYMFACPVIKKRSRVHVLCHDIMEGAQEDPCAEWKMMHWHDVSEFIADYETLDKFVRLP
jgi:hypothetical protein